MSDAQQPANVELPDFFPTVASDVIEFTGRKNGVWLDVGSGSGGLGFTLVQHFEGTLILLDPSESSLDNAIEKAARLNIAHRVVPIIGVAEHIPLPAGSVDVVVSRGSIFFWDDQAAGVGDIYRVMRTGGKAMIGGGLGTGYPQWARKEFVRRRRESCRGQNPDELDAFKRARHPDTYRSYAVEAGVPSYEVIGEAGLDETDSAAGMGMWLRFTKDSSDGR